MNTPKDKPARRTIGILPGWPANESGRPDRYLTSVFQGIQTMARIRGCNVLLAWGIGHGERPKEDIPAWPVLSRNTDFVPVGPWNTDGLIVFSPLLNQNRSDYLQGVMAEGHPVLFIATGENGPAILADNEDGIHLAVAHLVEHGHRKIAFIAGDPKDRGDGQHRLEAYLAAIKEFDLDPDPRLIAHGNHRTRESKIITKQILASGVKFTALLGSDDNSAIGAMQALKEAGLRIPQDVAVMGFDDQPDAIAQVPPLASIHVPLSEIGKRALSTMLDFLEGDSPLKSVRVPTWVVTRQSCGCLPDTVIQAADSKPVQKSRPLGKPGTDDFKGKAILQLANSMMTALPSGSLLFNKNHTHEICTQLVEAFYGSLENGIPTQFEITLMEFLQGVELTDNDSHSWQQVISVLRREMPHLPLNWKQEGIFQQAEDLLHQARVAISESARRRYHREQYQRSAESFLLSELIARLSTTLNAQRAIELLTEYLRQMDIHHARVALFEAEADDPVAWSVVIDPDPNAKRLRFPSRQFPPPGLYSPDLCLSLSILPLVFQNESIGYIAFDASHLEFSSAIARQLVATFKSARLYEEVVELSLTDALTGLQNRRYFDLTLKSEIDRSRRFMRGLSIIMIDIDHFKQYNDTFGHPAGDEALRLVADCLQRNRRKADIVTRIGGEEFALILPETNLNGALEVANRIRSLVETESKFKRQLTVCLGVAELNNPQDEPEILVQQADKALYEAKRTGRNRVSAYQEEERPI